MTLGGSTSLRYMKNLLARGYMVLLLCLIAALLAACVDDAGGTDAPAATTTINLVDPEPTDSEPSSSSVPESKATPTPAQAPVLQLDPTPTPAPPPSEAWLNPESAIRTAARHNNYAPYSPVIDRLAERAFIIRGYYHLVTADAGQFNGDTHGFLPWLVDHFESLFDPTSQQDHLDAQVRAAFLDHSSEIAIKMARIAAYEDPYRPMDSQGNMAYWYDLILPARGMGISEQRMGMMFNMFQRVSDEYLAYLGKGGTVHFTSFVLEGSDYLTYWCFIEPDAGDEPSRYCAPAE